MTQAVRGQPLTVVVRAQTQTSPYGICAEQVRVAPGQVFLRVLWLSSVSVIPSVFHTY